MFALGSLPCLADVHLTRIDGAEFTGELRAVHPAVVLTTAEGDVRVEWADVLRLKFAVAEQHSTTAASGGMRFVLADGSSFAGRLRGDRDERLAVEAPVGLLSFPATALRAIVASSPTPAALERIEPLAAAWNLPNAATRSTTESAAESQDAVVLVREERVAVLRGRAQRVTGDLVQFRWNDRDIDLPWPRIQALFLTTERTAAECLVQTDDGDRYAGHVQGGTGDSLTIATAALGELTFAWERLERIDCRGNRIVFLSDVEPERYDFEPFLEQRWDFVRDRTFSGRPIRLGGRTFDKGLCMHSRARLRYRIEPGFVQFAAAAGVLDEMGERGDVDLRVFGDDRLLWEATGVHGGEAPRSVLIDLAGVTTLTLEADFGGDLDLSDQACWAFARLIREP